MVARRTPPRVQTRLRAAALASRIWLTTPIAASTTPDPARTERQPRRRGADPWTLQAAGQVSPPLVPRRSSAASAARSGRARRSVNDSHKQGNLTAGDLERWLLDGGLAERDGSRPKETSPPTPSERQVQCSARGEASLISRPHMAQASARTSRDVESFAIIEISSQVAPSGGVGGSRTLSRATAAQQQLSDSHGRTAQTPLVDRGDGYGSDTGRGLPRAGIVRGAPLPELRGVSAPPPLRRGLRACATDALGGGPRAEFAEPIGPVLEHPQDRFSVGDVEGQHLQLAAPRGLEPVGQVVELGVIRPACELEHARVGHRYACQEHVFDYMRPGKPGAGDRGAPQSSVGRDIGGIPRSRMCSPLRADAAPGVLGLADVLLEFLYAEHHTRLQGLLSLSRFLLIDVWRADRRCA